MKKLLKIILYLGALALLLSGIWLGINLWPEKKMEPPLWTPADLYIPEAPAGNGYRTLVEMRSKPLAENKEESPGSHEVGWLDNKMVVYNWPSMSKERIAFFWEEAKFVAPALSRYLQTQGADLQNYNKLLESPSFINIDSPLVPLSREEKDRRDAILGRLHFFVSETVVQDALQGNLGEAYASWLKLFRMDQSMYLSDPSFPNRPLEDLQLDLNLFALLRIYPLPEDGEKYIEAIRDFDPEKYDLRRPLIVEYLRELAAADDVLAKKNEGESLFFRLGFHRARFQSETNDFFRRLEALLKKDPKALDGTSLKPFRQEIYKLRKGFSSFFYDPSGKELRSHLVNRWILHFPELTRGFLNSVEDFQKRKTLLLATPFFAKGPESQETESRPETQGSETKPAETHPSESKPPDAAEIQKEAL